MITTLVPPNAGGSQHLREQFLELDDFYFQFLPTRAGAWSSMSHLVQHLESHGQAAPRADLWNPFEKVETAEIIESNY
jgi:hypothetical protein